MFSISATNMAGFFNDMEANRTEFNPADFSLVGMASDNEQEEGVHGP